MLGLHNSLRTYIPSDYKICMVVRDCGWFLMIEHGGLWSPLSMVVTADLILNELITESIGLWARVKPT